MVSHPRQRMELADAHADALRRVVGPTRPTSSNSRRPGSAADVTIVIRPSRLAGGETRRDHDPVAVAGDRVRPAELRDRNRTWDPARERLRRARGRSQRPDTVRYTGNQGY